MEMVWFLIYYKGCNYCDMEPGIILQVILKCIAVICGVAIVVSLLFGGVRGLYWEMQLRNKRRHRY